MRCSRTPAKSRAQQNAFVRLPKNFDHSPPGVAEIIPIGLAFEAPND